MKTIILPKHLAVLIDTPEKKSRAEEIMRHGRKEYVNQMFNKRKK